MDQLILPDVRFRRVSNSELQTYAGCRVQHDYKYRQRIYKVGQPSYHLHLGSGVHAALQAYYDPENLKRGKRQRKLLEERFMQWHDQEIRNSALYLQKHDRYLDDESLQLLSNARALGQKMVIGYGEYAEKIDDFTVVATEMKFMVPIHDEFGVPIPGFFFFGYIDMVVRLANGHLMVWETKTSSDSRLSTDHLGIDNQHSRYLLAMRSVFPDDQIDGGIHQFLRKQAPGPRVKLDLFHREETYRTPTEVDLVEADLRKQVIEMYGGEPNVFPNYGPGCKWCDYFNLCVLRKDGRDYSVVVEEEYIHNPRVEEREYDWVTKIQGAPNA